MEEQKYKQLTETEKSSLSVFWDNQTMREAVRTVILGSLKRNYVVKGNGKDSVLSAALDDVIEYGSDTHLNPLIPNEALGADFRAKFEAARMVENAFNELSRFTIKKPEEPQGNQAR